MPDNNQDKFLEEIDSELKSLNKRLRSVMSEANALLMEYQSKEQEEDPSQASEIAHEEKSEEVEKKEE